MPNALRERILTERQLFAACGVHYPTAEQAYRIHERIGMMCGAGPVTDEAIAEAVKDLARFAEEEYKAKFPKGEPK